MKKALAALLLASLAACSPPAGDTPVDAPSSPVAAATPAALSPSGESADVPSKAYDGTIPMAIVIGSEGPETDACGTLAKVKPLDGQDVDYLSVRDAPSGSTKERDRLEPGQQVFVCAGDGDWSGVVYAAPGSEPQDCGVSSPVAAQEPYRGSCRQGWVVTQYLEVLAG
ncbi:hypothetical protein [Porphyrobacter sp. YT40]|uniref:hypothetical protein n=1 Tax=Porphyrobacter sp. YT40 TaxID=2547601 RepID=UPI001142606F|nr:hypothetical protein [Porphyrobacter sp. YT40]QDH34859.1 hypothetical protein E2E27_11315 [Porphyrobacter sp. YT40]